MGGVYGGRGEGQNDDACIEDIYGAGMVLSGQSARSLVGLVGQGDSENGTVFGNPSLFKTPYFALHTPLQFPCCEGILRF